MIYCREGFRSVSSGCKSLLTAVIGDWKAFETLRSVMYAVEMVLFDIIPAEMRFSGIFKKNSQY